MNIDRNNKIDEIISSIDGIQHAPMPDFFYTRLKARMVSQLDSKISLPVQSTQSWILRPAYAFAALLLVLAINTAVILKGNQNIDAADSDTELMQSIAAEYKINTNLTYEINQ